jgi:hypothetical protein
MSLFNSILHTLQKKIDAQNAYKETVSESIQQVIGVKIPPSAVTSLKEGVLIIQSSPSVKMAILLKREKILAVLKERGLTVSVIK